jgi:hypothetical protein
VLLNEVNLGIDYLRQELHARDPRLEVSTGPIMLAKGREVTEGSKAKGKTETTLNGKDVNVTGSQHEYYAAVYRKADKTKDDGGVTLQGTFYIGTDGMFIEQERPGEKQEKSKTNNAISWNKAKDAEFGQSFRGVVVHRFLQHGQELWSAVIHTTPAGHGLDRKEIWPQIKKPAMLSIRPAGPKRCRSFLKNFAGAAGIQNLLKNFAGPAKTRSVQNLRRSSSGKQGMIRKRTKTSSP